MAKWLSFILPMTEVLPNMAVFVDDGNVILNAVKEDLINVSHSIQLGVRGGYNSKEESTLFLEQGMKLLSAYEMHKMTLEEICTIIKRNGFRSSLYHFPGYGIFGSDQCTGRGQP